MKLIRRDKKCSNKHGATAEEVIFIFEKVLEGWKTVRIYNTIIQNNPIIQHQKSTKRRQLLFLEIIVYMIQNCRKNDINIILNSEKKYMNIIIILINNK